jgi:hypothetical protein
MICCVLCFSVTREQLKYPKVDWANVSIDLLLGGDSGSFCTHEFLTAAQLAKKLVSFLPSNLSISTRLGWSVICQILQQIEDQYTWAETGIPPAGYEDEHEELEFSYNNPNGLDYHKAIWYNDAALGAADCEHLADGISRAFGKNRLLGHIWAACQCELLTYRRLRTEDAWMSKRIDVAILANCLEIGSAEGLPYIKGGLLKEYCVCGMFDPYQHCRREQTCSKYFSNLDDWNRTTFLDDTIFEE